jgi:hypothetical protein
MTTAGPIRHGMIGGVEGAFIGGVHRTAAAVELLERLVLLIDALELDLNPG